MKRIRLTPMTRQMCVQTVMSAPDGWIFHSPTEPTRSLDQNSLIHVWYAEIAQQIPEDDALGWKCYCKLHHGVPILRAEDEGFRIAYDGSVKGLTYEQKLLAMRMLPVTSLMNTKQLSKYAEAVQADFERRGVLLQFPEAA